MLRIGSVPYLNARVLIHDLAAEQDVSLDLLPPSILARKLATGSLDAALVSSIEYFRHPEYRAIPGLSVSGRHEMWSIQLFHRVPLTAIRSVRLDTASETTNALVRILLKERWSIEPAYFKEEGTGIEERGASSEPPQASSLRPQASDAFLLIGDPALTFSHPDWHALDLLSVWRELTGLPFVFALWLARPGIDIEALGARLRRCRDEGLKQAVLIAGREAPRHGLTLDRTLRYISEIVHYDLGEHERAALRRFQEYLLKHRLLDKARPDI
jgi:chorismate dehydratase